MSLDCPHYNQGLSKDDVECYLRKMRKCVESGSFTIALGRSREKNRQFIADYNLDDKKIRNILLDIKTDDFCHTLNNTKPGYEHEVLYVFAPKKDLIDAGGEKNSVTIYTKFNLITINDGSTLAVISLHEAERNIEYAFTGRTD